MVAFLNQTSSVFTNYQKTNYPSGSAYKNALSLLAYDDFVFENGVNLRLGVLQEAWNYKSSENYPVLDSTTK